jgi:hypothetical protein
MTRPEFLATENNYPDIEGSCEFTEKAIANN